MIAQVLVDVKSKNVNKTYDYLVPEAFMGFLELGARVVVPFGNRAVMGFVFGFLEDSEYSKKLKSISKVLDIESFLTSELIDIAKDLSVRTNTILIRVLETILPSALKLQPFDCNLHQIRGDCCNIHQPHFLYWQLFFSRLNP